MNMGENSRVLILFFIINFILTITFLLLCIAVPIFFLQILIPWTPNITAILLILFYLKEERGVRKLASGWKKWKAHPKWYLLAFSPIFAFFVIAMLYLLLGGVPPGPSSASVLGLSFPLLMILAVFTGATGEELGWRGFALPRLQRQYSAVTSSILLGFYWGIWHIPGWILFNQPFTIESTFLFVSMTILHSIVITCICNNTRGSILLASIFHWTVNVASNYVVVYLGLVSWSVLNWGQVVIFTLISVILIIYYGPSYLSRDPALGYPELLNSDLKESIK
ncbi:MAG: CPBP family intramembrane glutamic endopeptidase [Candidatus Thorarchaeota archaeon]|jgi:membrane protease YdiL (CAAX protease family)